MSEEYEQLKKDFKDDPSDVEKHLSRLFEVVIKHDSEEFIHALKDDFLDPLMGRVKALKNKHEDILAKICVEYMMKMKEEFYEEARHIFQEKDLIDWKGHEGDIYHITQIIVEPVLWKLTAEEKHQPLSKTCRRALEDIVKAMIDIFSRDGIKDFFWSFRSFFALCFQRGSERLNAVAIVIANSTELIWEDEYFIASVMKTFDKWLRRDYVDLKENDDHRALARAISSSGSLRNAGKLSLAYLKNIMEYCLDQELEGDGESLSMHGQIVHSIICDFILPNAEMVEKYKDLMPYLKKLLGSDVKQLQKVADRAIKVTDAQQKLASLKPTVQDEGVADVDALVDTYVNDRTDRSFTGEALRDVLQSNPDVIRPRIDCVAGKMKEMGTKEKQLMYCLLGQCCVECQEVLDDLARHVEMMLDDACNPSLSIAAFNVLSQIFQRHPECFIKHTDKLCEAWEHSSQMSHVVCQIFRYIGLHNEEGAAKSLKILFDQLGHQSDINHPNSNFILDECNTIGAVYKECLAVYRPNIKKLEADYHDSYVMPLIQEMLDSIAGISLHGLDDDVEELRQDVSNSECRVTNMESEDSLVAKHGDETETQQVKNGNDRHDGKLGELEEVAEEKFENLEEIDHKAIDDTPKWSHDVSKLLNPVHEHDWRFLAVRLGYSVEEMFSWAVSPDPTMAMLAEWYTTHKSSDATYAILSELEDMSRTDVTEVITQSFEEAESLVLQMSPDQSEKTPAVFLSYQWDHQPEVKAIRKHLEMAGFPCWMDIGQMGGGDQLFAKISEGMKSSKVVLCMVTEKYTQSENCYKEVYLANLLNKPIIPILIDQTRWPPEGAMSMLFAQLLYIQFYNDKEYVRGEKFWEDAKFSELLGQISYHVNPDQSMVSDEYRNLVPEINDVLVTKKISHETKGSKQRRQTQPLRSIDEPSVFISYQWDNQLEIKRLFSRLTSLGFHCWLDINHMDGRDSLYSKVEKGIRNAKVVLSCITPKYILSPNCRREVSLSGILLKPIIPLLLEEMTWPPEGPMGMTLTELLYFDFTQESRQASFNDGNFLALVMKIKMHAWPTLDIVKDKETGTTVSSVATRQNKRYRGRRDNNRSSHTSSTFCLLI